MIELERDAPPPDVRGLLAPRWWRRLGLVVVAAVSATALVAAVPPAGGGLVEVARVESAVVTMRIAGSTLLAVTFTGSQRLTAYRLADGAQRWTVPLPVNSQGAPARAIDVVDGVALVSSGVTTVAVDVATGQELWHSNVPRRVEVHVPHAIVVETYTVTTETGPSTETSGARGALWLRALDVRTGQQIWEYRAPAGWWAALPYVVDGADPASTFVVGSPDGQATTVDLATGMALTSAQIDSPVTAPAGLFGQQEWRYQIFGNQLLLDADGNMTAYDLSTLARQWSVRAPSADASLAGCGPWLCLDDGATLHALARDTGAAAWSMPKVGGQQELARLRQWIYRGPVPGDPGDASLFDPVTQRIVLDLGSWRFGAQPDPAAVLRLDGRRPDETWLGLLTDGPRVEPLGAVTGLNHQPCEVDTRGYVACLTIHGDLRVWRYRP